MTFPKTQNTHIITKFIDQLRHAFINICKLEETTVKYTYPMKYHVFFLLFFKIYKIENFVRIKKIINLYFVCLCPGNITF